MPFAGTRYPLNWPPCSLGHDSDKTRGRGGIRVSDSVGPDFVIGWAPPRGPPPSPRPPPSIPALSTPSLPPFGAHPTPLPVLHAKGKNDRTTHPFPGAMAVPLTPWPALPAL